MRCSDTQQTTEPKFCRLVQMVTLTRDEAIVNYRLGVSGGLQTRR